MAILEEEPKRYGCPKLIGLPDLVSATFPDLPPLCILELDRTKTSEEEAYMKLGEKFSSPEKCSKAYKRGIEKNREYEEAMWLAERSNKETKKETKKKRKRERKKVCIGVVGHPYILFDNYISLNATRKLKDMGVEVRTSFGFPKDAIDPTLSSLPEISWSLEREILAATCYFLQGKVDGVIAISSFPCGPLSIINEIISREVKKVVPWMNIILDEQTGEAGLVTRLESFIDIVKER
jgi:predicted nucleotide-binding protein (sugar kinase/HSP70/actin superfamily)